MERCAEGFLRSDDPVFSKILSIPMILPRLLMAAAVIFVPSYASGTCCCHPAFVNMPCCCQNGDDQNSCCKKESQNPFINRCCDSSKDGPHSEGGPRQDCCARCESVNAAKPVSVLLSQSEDRPRFDSPSFAVDIRADRPESVSAASADDYSYAGVPDRHNRQQALLCVWRN